MRRDQPRRPSPLPNLALINSRNPRLRQHKKSVEQRDEKQGSALVVDWTRCDGHGLCAALLPDQISRDEWGFPIVRDGRFADRDARRVAAVCPALALRVISHEQ
jgi:ferredoxin